MMDHTDSPKGSPVLGINRRNLEYVFKDYYPGRFRDLDDKLATKMLLEKADVPCPRTLAVIRDRTEAETLPAVLRDLDSVVIKPAGGSGGDGILVLQRRGTEWMKLSGDVLSMSKLRDHVELILSGAFSMDEAQDVAILEERIHPHPFFLELFPEGLADIRIVLHRGNPVQAMCRLPSSTSEGKANLHSGGIGLGIDIHSGRTRGGVCRGRAIEIHPDTGKLLSERVIPRWDACLDTAGRASRVVDVEYLGVDIVMDRDRGPMVLELNARPGLDIQIANRDGQPVEASGAPSLMERGTHIVSWLLLAALAASPLVYSRWRSEQRNELSVAVASIGNGGGSGGGGGGGGKPGAAGYQGVNWEDEEVPLSSQHEQFRQARTLAAAGDTAAALQAYQAAVADSAVAPFALNNIALIHRHRGRRDLAEKALREALVRFPDYVRGHYNLGLILQDGGNRDQALAEFKTALDLDGSHARSWAKVAEIRLDTGETAAAVAAYEQAVRFAPASRAYRFGLGKAYRELRRFDLAAECFEQVLSLDPDNHEASCRWAQSVLDGSYATGTALSPDALESLDEALEPHAERREAPEECRAVLAELDWERGEFLDALRIHEDLVSRKVDAAFHRKAGGVAALEIGLWDRAEALLEALPEGSPPAANWLEACRIGRYIEDEGLRGAGTGIELKPSTDPVREAFRRLLAVDRQSKKGPFQGATAEDSLARLLLSPEAAAEMAGERSLEPWLAHLLPPRSRFRDRIHMETLPGSLLLWTLFRSAEAAGEDSVAAAALAVLGDRDPEFRPLVLRRFEAALAEGRLKTAERLGKRLLSLSPDDPKVLVRLASLYGRRGSVERSREYLDRLGASDRRQIPARVVEGRILLAEGKRGDAVRILRDLVRKSPSDVGARMALADAYLASGQRKRAIKELRIATEGAPGETGIRRRLARGLMGSRRYEEAVVEWGHLVQLQPDNLSDRFNLALCLQRSDRLEEATVEYDRLLARVPDHAKAWFNRSLALEKLGRIGEAREGYRKVLELNPDHDRSKEKLAALEGE